MNNILVTTDFSQPANHAAIFAAELARRAGARLILFHAYHPAILLEEDTIWADNEALEKEVQDKIDALAHDIHKNHGISVTRVLKPGFAVDEILDISKKVKADLLVIGTEGAGQRVKTGPGKICTEVLKKATLPAICLSPGTTLEMLSETEPALKENGVGGNAAGLELVASVISAVATKKNLTHSATNI